MPPLETLQFEDSSGWEELNLEARGKRAKRWIRGRGLLWLRKEPRHLRPTEPAIESMTLRLARAAGLAASESRLTTWRDPARGSKQGILVRRFLDDAHTETLSEGIRLLPPVRHGYDPQNRGHHTLSAVRDALERNESRLGVPLLKPFAEMLLFDAWIGNSDRHQENWGIIEFGRSGRLAPLYDTAACLGVELTDGAELLAASCPSERRERYVEACGSGFGDGSRSVIPQRDLVLQLKGWPEWNQSLALLSRFRELLAGGVSDYLATVPPEWLARERHNFVIDILERRLKWLESLP